MKAAAAATKAENAKLFTTKVVNKMRMNGKKKEIKQPASKPQACMHESMMAYKLLQERRKPFQLLPPE